jgi:hypothetical protein
MSVGPGAIIDAGPALTFLARKDTTRILYAGLGRADLLAPTQVEREVIRKSRQEKRRFGAAEATWNTIVAANRLTVLPDDETAELAAAVQRLCLMPMSERMRQQQDLGELLVIAHAAVRAEAGDDVAVLIQERNGTAMAYNEAPPHQAPRRHRSSPSVGYPDHPAARCRKRTPARQSNDEDRLRDNAVP